MWWCVGRSDLDEMDEMEVVGPRDAEGEERDMMDYRQQLEADKEMRRGVRREQQWEAGGAAVSCCGAE